MNLLPGATVVCCNLYIFCLSSAVNLKPRCAILPSWIPHVSCSPWSLPTLLFFLQKNWLCASQDDSLLPLTALAELTMGDHFTTDGTKTPCFYIHFSVLPSFPFLSFSLLHSSIAADTLMKPHGKLAWICPPCGQPDVTLWPLSALASPCTPKTLTTPTTHCGLDTTSPCNNTATFWMTLTQRLCISWRSERWPIRIIHLLGSEQDTFRLWHSVLKK